MLHSKRNKRRLQMALMLTLTSLSSLAIGSESSVPEGICEATIPLKGMTILKAETLIETGAENYRNSGINVEQTPRLLIPNNHVEFEGHTIGDSHRSSDSFQSFFASVDLDGDGKIRRPELDMFLQEIGGSAFDEIEERENEVGIIMDKMDLEGDGRLEMGDVNSYWEKLESLLTVDEVAEWIVHAGQLPKEVGRIFREHHVTGYDFPELVENKGQALHDELVIDPKFRTKIVRAVNGRMFGIGEVPSKPGDIFARVESCSTIALRWTKAQTNSLPVHKYRVARRKIGGSNSNVETRRNHSKIPMGNSEVFNDSNDILDLDGDVGDGTVVKATSINDHKEGFGSCPLTFDGDSLISKSSEWTTVYDGSETECVDSGLERGKAYMYRIQAWNLVGKSEWAVLDPTESWVEHGCNEEPLHVPVPEIDDASPIVTKVTRHIPEETILRVENITEKKPEHNSIFIRCLQLIAAWGGYIVNGALTLGALSTTFMRVRRATVTSTAARIEPFFPWAFRHINKFLEKTTGIEFIPQKFTMGRHEALSLHDNVVKSVGLNGYMLSPPEIHLSERINTDRTQSTRELLRSQSEQCLDSNKTQKDTTALIKGKSKKEQRAGPFSRKRSQKSPLSSMREISKTIHTSEIPIESRTDLISHGSEDENKRIQITEQPISSISKAPSNVRRFGRTSKINAFVDSTDSNRRDTAKSGHVNTRTFGTTMHLKQPHSISFDSIGNQNRGKMNSQYPEIEDHNRCNSCHKKYKFPKRCRHHCARCGATFCHKHGNPTHNNFVSCKVPGDCVCNVCLGVN